MDKKLKVLDEKKKTIKKRKNIFIFTLTTQLIVCIIIVFGLLLTKFFFKTQYDNLTSRISFALKDNSLKGFFENFLTKLKEKNKNLKKQQPEESEKKETDESKQQPDESKQQPDELKEKKKSFEQQQERVKLIDVEESFNGLCSSNDDDVIFFTFVKPLNGRVTSKYGKRENPVLKGEQDFHYGVDISAKDNTPVVSIADGVVELIANSKKSGNFISIRHGEFYESLYAHCNKILVDKGAFVKKGEKIALSGHTGNTTGAHLHLGIKKNGSWINPIYVFPNLT